MKKSILFSFLALAAAVANAQTISDARNLSIGQTVTITGVATNGSELGNIRYIQDGTAALPAFGSSLSTVQRGDSITATGVLFDFNGLLEISPTNSFVKHGSGTLPTPLVVPITSVNESIEAQLVRIDNVNFVQTGNFATGNSTVQITDGTNTLDVRINGSTQIDGTAILSGPISIVGLVGQFNAKYQLIPRDPSDIFPYVAPPKEINVKIGNATILNNNEYVIGNNATTTIIIENTGVQSLNISGISFSGTNATDFNTTFTSATISGNSSQNFVVNFSPTGTGSRTASLIIANDDADENPYTINLFAVGTDNLATEPTSNPTGLTFPLVKAYTIAGQYAAGVNAEKYLVLWKNGSAVSEIPVDGTSYRRGDLIGNAKVAYVGSGTGFTPRHVIANQNYHFAVFAFNGPEGFENYKTSSPAIGNVASQGAQIGNYYAGINSNSTNFLTSLSALINPHTYVSYFNYKTTMMNQFEVRDTTGGKSYVVCAYSGERKVFDDPFDWTATGYSREHTYSHSWMPTFPADNPEQKEYNDQHNLYPTNLQQANTPRSNLPMDEIVGTPLFSYLEGKVGYNSNNQMVYEPRDAQKGNAARSIFYMATCYNGQLGNNWQIPSNQSQAILKQWHFNDLPDNYEIARNEFIHSIQNNRNPYIDSTDFVCHVNFSNMSYDACQSAALSEQLERNLTVFPVPANNKIYAQVNGINITSYAVLDMQGRSVESHNNTNIPVLELNINTFKSGLYILKIGTTFGEVQRQIIIE